MDVLDMIHQGRQALTYLETIEGQTTRIMDLVLRNKEFFGDIRPGTYILDHAADKLEELIEEWKSE